MQRLSVLIICFLLVLSVSAQDDVVMLTVDTSEVIGEVGGDDDIVTQFTYTDQGLLDIITDPLG
ncbi:MAG: hypothetical protein AAFN11_20835, partial [Chloroflexota bacterium]